MAELVGLLFLLLTVLFIALPILTFLRLGRISLEIEDLRERLRALESASAAAKTTPQALPVASASARAESQASYGPHVAADAPVAPEPRTVPDAPDAPDAPIAPVAADVPIAQVAADAPDLESRIGGRGLLYVGVLVLLIGVSFFLKYAFDNAWIDETGRVVLGALAGIALIVAGRRFSAGGLAVFGQALAGGGLAILFLAIYAALNFYALISMATGFVLMVAVSAAAALLADRERSQPLAVIAVGGGFLTPFLVGGEQHSQLMLVTYVSILIGATALLSLRHQWLALNGLSYLLTYLTVLAWASRSYTDREWLRTFLFLTLFTVLFLVILRESRRAAGQTARLVAGLLATAPLLYHLAAVIITARHAPAIHLYLIAFTVVGLWLTAEPHRPWLRLAALLAAFVPMFGTLTLPDGLSWIVPNAITIGGVAALHFIALIDRIVRQEEMLDTPELISLHVAGIGLFSLLAATLHPAYPEFRGALAALLALASAGLWQWLQSRDPVASLNAAALAFTLAALAVAVQFDAPAVVIGWAAEGAAAAWVGVRARNRAFQIGGLALLTLAAVRLLDDYFVTPASFVAVLNARALTTIFLIALGYLVAGLFARRPGDGSRRVRTGLHIACTLLSLLCITADIRSYWEVRYTSPQAYLYQQVMLSLAWGVYAAVLITVGLWRAYATARYIGIAVIIVTALKVFFFDFWELGGIYRVIGFIGFGALLVLVSYMYQRRRTRTLKRPSPATEAPSDAARP